MRVGLADFEELALPRNANSLREHVVYGTTTAYYILRLLRTVLVHIVNHDGTEIVLDCGRDPSTGVQL